jgi:filamentous hemagglutinin family protein
MFRFNKKIRFCLFASFLYLPWFSFPGFALPSNPHAEFGTVEVTRPNPHTMLIDCSDGAILQYEDFNVGPLEEVHFLQKSATHCIKGKHSSEILGSIQSSGTLVFVNDHGIHFGPNSKLSSEEGSISLSAPHILNLGSIEAKSGHVSLSTGEEVNKDAKIEHLGSITGYSVSIKLPIYTKSITERNETHELFEGDEGVLWLGMNSQITAQIVDLQAFYISLEGFIDAASTSSHGGKVHVFGNEISLQKAKIDVSGTLGGGKVLIGGGFRVKAVHLMLLKFLWMNFLKSMQMLWMMVTEDLLFYGLKIKLYLMERFLLKEVLQEEMEAWWKPRLKKSWK